MYHHFLIFDKFLMNFHSCWDIHVHLKNVFSFDKDAEKAKYDPAYNGLSPINNRVSGDKVKPVSMAGVIYLSVTLTSLCHLCDIDPMYNVNLCITCHIDLSTHRCDIDPMCNFNICIKCDIDLSLSPVWLWFHV